eukprot:1425972-Heterocapsa_arctica.AAC.1
MYPYVDQRRTEAFRLRLQCRDPGLKLIGSLRNAKSRMIVGREGEENEKEKQRRRRRAKQIRSMMSGFWTQQ